MDALEKAISNEIDRQQGTPPPAATTKEVAEEEPVVAVDDDGTDETGGEDSPGSEEDALGDDELKEAANLYKLLRDKDTRRLVLRTLGEKAGLFDQPLETKKEVAAARRGIKEILSDTLGKEYDFMIPKLGAALELILDEVKAENQQSLGQVQQEQINAQVSAELSELARETKGVSRGLEAKMSALALKFPAGEGLSVKEYVRGLYAMANDGKSTTDSKKIADRIHRNSRDVPSRLTSATGALKDSPRNLGKMSLDQSVKHALKQLGMGE